MVNASHVPTVLQNYPISGINPAIKQPFPSPGIPPSSSGLYHPGMGTTSVLNHLHPTLGASPSVGQRYSAPDAPLLANHSYSPTDVQMRTATQNPFTTIGVPHQHTVVATTSAMNTPITTPHPVTPQIVLPVITQPYAISGVPSMSGVPLTTQHPYTTNVRPVITPHHPVSGIPSMSGVPPSSHYPLTTTMHPAISQPYTISGITTVSAAPLTSAIDDASTFKVTSPPQQNNIQDNVPPQKLPLASAKDKFASEVVETRSNRIDQIDGHLGRAAEMLKMTGVADEVKDNENFQNLKDNKHFPNSLDLELEQNTSGDILNVTLSDDGILQDEPIERADRKEILQSSTKDEQPSNESGENDRTFRDSGAGDKQNKKAECEMNAQISDATFQGGGDATISTESEQNEEGQNVVQEKFVLEEQIKEKADVKSEKTANVDENEKGVNIEGGERQEQVTPGEVLPLQEKPVEQAEGQYAEGQQWDESNPEYYQQYGQQDDQYYQYAEGEYDQQQYAQGEYDQQQYAEGEYDQQQYAGGEYDAQYAEQYGMYDQQYPQYTEEEYQAYQQHEAEKVLAAAQAQESGQAQESTEANVKIESSEGQETSGSEHKVEENVPDKVQGENDTNQGESVQKSGGEKAASNVEQYRQLLGVPPSGETETSETDELEAELAALVDPKHDGEEQRKQSLKPSISEEKTSNQIQEDPEVSTTSESNVPAPVEPKKEETKTSETAESEEKVPGEPSKPVESETKTSQPTANRSVSKKLPDLNKMLESDSESLQLDATVSNAESDDFEFSSEK
ncbi:hypothetical protein C0J52_11420 [Blattella germanica]|nr:hypothetical protein C0J52_11420 [Blattella germanica]